MMRIIDNIGNVYTPTTDGDKIIIKKEDVVSETEYLEVQFDEWEACVGEEGYYVLSDASKKGSLLCYFKDKEEAEYLFKQNTMPIFGVKKRDSFFLLIADGMKYSFYMRVGLKDGKYYAAARFLLDGDVPYEDISFYIIELGKDAEYSDMANYYRDYQLQRGACVPLKERVKGNNHLKYAVDSVYIRIRMGWKPAPARILEQTIENEPEMKVACTFDRVKDIIDELKRQGVDKAELCLVGWNISGHDGRWPQMFPVEEKLGGETKLRELIRYAQENGYQIVCHTNSTDCYHIANDYSEELIVKKKDGSLQIDPLNWSGGRAYHLCAQTAYELAKRDLPKVADLGFKGVHYIDVISVIPLRKCYAPNHPVNESKANDYYREIAMDCKNMFGGFSSEGVFDFAAEYLDYGLYATFEDNDMAFFDREIPLWQMVYNGIIMHNPSTTTVNYPIKSPQSRLKVIEYGGRPSFYYYSKFITNAHNVDWLGKEDLECGTEEDLRASVAYIKEAYEEYKTRQNLQYEFMIDHRETAPGVYEVTYSDGTVVQVDYKKLGVKVYPGKFR